MANNKNESITTEAELKQIARQSLPNVRKLLSDTDLKIFDKIALAVASEYGQMQGVDAFVYHQFLWQREVLRYESRRAAANQAENQRERLEESKRTFRKTEKQLIETLKTLAKTLGMKPEHFEKSLPKIYPSMLKEFGEYSPVEAKHFSRFVELYLENLGDPVLSRNVSLAVEKMLNI